MNRTESRLDIRRRQWAWQDKQKGYAVYRQTRPAYIRKQKKLHPMIADVAMLLALAVVVWLTQA